MHDFDTGLDQVEKQRECRPNVFATEPIERFEYECRTRWDPPFFDEFQECSERMPVRVPTMLTEVCRSAEIVEGKRLVESDAIALAPVCGLFGLASERIAVCLG